jgi:hypothetical protein
MLHHRFTNIFEECLLPRNFSPSHLLPKNKEIKIQKTIILPARLYRYEIWFLALREKRILRVYENRVLRRIFGYNRYQVTEDQETT